MKRYKGYPIIKGKVYKNIFNFILSKPMLILTWEYQCNSILDTGKAK